MARARPQLNNFTAGELDPLLDARSDLEHYHRGARSLKNVIPLPQGGVKRRPGMKFIAQVSEPGMFELFRLQSFEFSDDQVYLVVFRDQRIDIYKNDAFFASVTDEVDDNDVVVGPVPWTEAQLNDIRTTQSLDTMIVVHGSHAPRKLLRDTTVSPEVFKLLTLELTNVPQFDFKDAQSPDPDDVDEVQRLEFIDTWADQDRYRLELENHTTDRLRYLANANDHAQSIQDELRALSNTSNSGIEVIVDPAPPNPDNQTFLVKFLREDGGKDWPLMIVVLGDSTLGDILITEDKRGGSQLEDVWSATRGWPKTAVFHQGRLWFGGSPSRPATVWASRAGDFFNFEVGDALDAEAIDATLDSDEIAVVQHLHSGRDLTIFTTNGEFITPADTLTPSEIKFKIQTRHGSSEIEPVTVDGAVLFVDERKRAVREFLFEFAEDAYRGDEISILSQHLIRDPRSMAVQKTKDGDYLWLANGDGSLVVLNVNRAQGIKTWSRMETVGQVFQVVAVDDEIYMTVLRGFGGDIHQFIEKIDPTLVTDAAVVSTTGGAAWGGFGHLTGAEVDVLADGVYQGRQDVIAGFVLTEQDDYTQVEAGLPFDVEVVPMPVAVQARDGDTLTLIKSVPFVRLVLQDSRDVYVEGYRVEERKFGAAVPTKPPLLNGIYEVRRLGWGRQPLVNITQEKPGPFTLLGLAFEVEV